MMYGISDKSFAALIAFFEESADIERVVIFGSRAMGNYRNGSDIDLAVWGSGLTSSKVQRFSATLNEEMQIPYMVDLLYYDEIHNEALKEHINTHGLPIFTRLENE